MTKQNDAAAMTEEQLDAVVGGYELKNVLVVSMAGSYTEMDTAGKNKRRSNRTGQNTSLDSGSWQTKSPGLGSGI